MMKIIYAILALFVSLPAAAADPAVKISGRIFNEHGVLEGGRVYLYRSYGDIAAGKPVAVSEPADDRGVYTANIARGSYYFVGRGTQNGKEFYAYHGKNPVSVESDKAWVTLLSTEKKGEPAYRTGESSVVGRVTFKGKPVPGAYVSLYKTDADSFKGIGFRTESVNASGAFDMRIPFGKYVVIAKKSQEGKGNRPLKAGDLFCYYPDNPLEIRADEVARIEIPCYPKDEREAFVDNPFVKSAEYATVTDAAAARKAGVYGRVVDSAGKPVPRIQVLLYRTSQPVFLMYHLSHGTEHVAETDGEGRFFVPLDASGDYYLVARDTLGDGPHRGELYGIYQGNNRHVVPFEKGKEVHGISVTVTRVMDELAGKPVPASMPAAAPAAGVQDARTAAPTGIIAVDTTWQGTVVLDGPVVVKRGATLTIEPGTVVKFKKVDRDHNGVGDGEIMVEGKLVAVGTPAKPITFTSAEKNPAPRDYAYVQFLASDADNIFRYCTFSYGFSGVQVHYSKVRISECLFTHNYEGLHYNTADIVVDHNDFIENDTAIRFKRLEGKVRITDNLITGNETGVLFGRQQINAVDFKDLNKPVEMPVFTRNNIYGNRKYNYAMGEGQGLDIPVQENWWGAKTAAEIAAGLFDGESDASLGKIRHVPFQTKPVEGAGRVFR